MNYIILGIVDGTVYYVVSFPGPFPNIKLQVMANNFTKIPYYYNYFTP